MLSTILLSINLKHIYGLVLMFESLRCCIFLPDSVEYAQAHPLLPIITKLRTGGGVRPKLSRFGKKICIHGFFLGHLLSEEWTTNIYNSVHVKKH